MYNIIDTRDRNINWYHVKDAYGNRVDFDKAEWAGMSDVAKEDFKQRILGMQGRLDPQSGVPLYSIPKNPYTDWALSGQNYQQPKEVQTPRYTLGGDQTTKSTVSSEQFINPGNFQPLTNSVSTPVSTSNQSSGTLMTALQSVLDKWTQAGYAINPNVTITPELTAQFMAQAHNEIDPYYSNQLKVATDQFMTSLGYSANQIVQNEQNAQIQYGRQFKQLGETAAEQGFAQSGIRQRQEGELATDTQRSLDASRAAFQNATNLAAGKFAGEYGYSNLPGMTISNAPRVLAGQGTFSQDTTQSPVYSLSPSVYSGITGSQQYEKEGALRTRASQLEQGYRLNQSINQQRQLTL